MGVFDACKNNILKTSKKSVWTKEARVPQKTDMVERLSTPLFPPRGKEEEKRKFLENRHAMIYTLDRVSRVIGEGARGIDGTSERAKNKRSR